MALIMMKNKNYLLQLSFLITLFLCNLISAQEVKNVFLENTDKENRFYEEAYQNIDNMLNNKQEYSFKNAVFGVENAYYQGKLNIPQLEREINFLKAFSGSILKSRELKTGFEKAGTIDKIFGRTILAWKGDVESKYFGMTVDKTKGFTHAATYLGTSRNGTEYTFSKNGQGVNPKIETTS
ncbi:hypothetical protein [Chryseobacterium sp. SL1]|uniref:hypothetical protein n=1 Tax=Chryseobacterium sp. SL1 TaxID=2995159 RepID=UPI002275943B|nr:hypothetical protein [Chryseobacterium sp. SL1]MCY1660426.1 hypothetical protein [Chryseobacterium sp. SL1]